VKELREEIEKNHAVDITQQDQNTIVAVAVVLKQFLRDVTDGLVPRKYYQGLIDAGCK
jgi:hypothetical protein